MGLGEHISQEAGNYGKEDGQCSLLTVQCPEAPMTAALVPGMSSHCLQSASLVGCVLDLLGQVSPAEREATPERGPRGERLQKGHNPPLWYTARVLDVPTAECNSISFLRVLLGLCSSGPHMDITAG